jgi:hypothetical protein
VGVDHRRGADVSDIDGAGDQSLHGGGPGVERTPLQFYADRKVSLMEIFPFSFQLAGRQSRGVRQVREEAHPQNDWLFGRDRGGHGEKSEDKRSHGGHDERRRTALLIYDYIS